MTAVDGYAPEPHEIHAMLDSEIDDEDRSDPLRLYHRATAVTVRYSTVLAELTKLREDACMAMSDDGMSYADIAGQIGLSRARVQHMVRDAKVRRP